MTEKSSGSISLSAAAKLIRVPPWRRVPINLTARLKHLIGIHTYLPTLRTVMRPDGSVESLRVVSECVVCDEAPR